MQQSGSVAETLRYLETVRDGIANQLRPELLSDEARRVADSLTLVLGRLIERTAASNDSANARTARWDTLIDRYASFTGDAVDTEDTGATLATREQLERRLGSLQCAFDAGGEALAAHWSDPASAQSGWLNAVVRTLHDTWESVEDGMVPPRAPEASTASAITPPLRERLEAWLRGRFPSLPAGIVTDFHVYYGGYVKQSARFTLAPNELLPTHLVLRRDLAFSYTGTTTADEFPILERAFALGLPVPRPLLVEPDPAFLDGGFLIMEEVRDATVAGAHFAKERAVLPRLVGPEFGHDLARTLARLHAATEVSARDDAARSVDHAALLAQTRELQRQWSAMPRPPLSLSLDLGFGLLLARPLPPERPRCLVHADCGLHNILVRDGRLAALLDWELAHEGDPAEDLSIVRLMVCDDVIAWNDFTRTYIAAGGNPLACDEGAVAWHAVLLFAKNVVMAAGVRANFHRGARPDAIAASVAAHIVDRLIQYHARALHLACSALT